MVIKYITAPLSLCAYVFVCMCVLINVILFIAALWNRAGHYIFAL